MSFTSVGTLTPYGGPVLRTTILTNSETFTVQDSIKNASGFGTAGTAGALVFGHINSIVTSKGVGVLSTGAAGAAFGSFVGTYLTASNNQTVGQVKAAVDISKESLYSATLSAAAGTTTGSNLISYTMDLSTSILLNEGSALATTGQYMSWGLDPNNTAQVLVNIFESQVFGV